MSGKHILDAITVFRASSKVAANHFAIRYSQVELYSKTSSLVKTARDSRIASFPSSRQKYSQKSTGDAAKGQTSEINSVPNLTSNEFQRGLNQEEHYERSSSDSVLEASSSESIEVEQAQAARKPLPDGTIPPADSLFGTDPGDLETDNIRPTTEPGQHPLKSTVKSQIAPESSQGTNIPVPHHPPISAEKAKRLQRQYEKQIPESPAEPPKGAADDEDSVFSVAQDQDVFYTPETATPPVLSALPRVKVPKVENNIQGSNSSNLDGINADVFYSGKKHGNDTDGLDKETLAQLFHGRRASKLLRNMPGSKQKYHTPAVRPQQNSVEKKELQDPAADMVNNVAAKTDSKVGAGRKPYEMRESRVPSSRVGRLFEYGGLAASMALGAVSEGFAKSGGSNGSLMLSPANMERLVSKLSKMRGAALKLGQMISFQDMKMLPKPIIEVLQRVQDSADYMPASQRDGVIADDLGSNWRDLFIQFEEKPMAAASIGQVHGAVLKDGTSVAVKVQYPGVAKSISSDLNNLSLLLNVSRLLPKGLYLDKTIANARAELAWECDYVREAGAAKKFQELLKDDKDTFTVPKIFDQASGKHVLTMQRMQGVAVTKIQNFSQEQKDWIGAQILRLCLREIIEFKYMQTDPNWTNFLYNKTTAKLELLDFGASREFPERFINLYVRVLEAAACGDRNLVGDLSVELGYLTGYESKAMRNAHVDSVVTLAEPFTASAPDIYDFQDQTITDRVRALIPVMVRERLAPPPEETYSLHRKLSGAFLLCARLGSKIHCKDLFQQGLLKSSSKMY